MKTFRISSLVMFLCSLFFFIATETHAQQYQIQRAPKMVLKPKTAIKGKVMIPKGANLQGKTPAQIGDHIVKNASVHLYDNSKFNSIGQKLGTKVQIVHKQTAFHYVIEYTATSYSRVQTGFPYNKPLLFIIPQYVLKGGGLGGIHMFFSTNPEFMIATLTSRDPVFEGYNFGAKVIPVPY